MTLKSMLAKLVVALLGILTSVEQLSTDLYQPGRWTVGDRAAYKQGEPEALDRSNFPKEMVFGVSSSAYQVPAHSCGVNMGVADRLFKYEGAVKEGGRGPCIWDTVAHVPGHTPDNSTGDLGIDQYHRYKEDVGLVKDLGVDAYRFSISWSRIFPGGVGPKVNREGVAYYNRLIDELVARGLTPYVTLWHWDLPQALEDAFGGWQSREVIPAFAAYAEVCFKEFGDRVKHWITMNEPHEFSLDHSNLGCKDPSGYCGFVSYRDAPYMMGHYVILSHAAAAQIYHNKYQAEQEGVIGITLDAQWEEPLTDSPEDLAAAERMKLFEVGWFLDPFFFGDYPEVMRSWLGNRLPHFTKEESEFIKGSVDFVGINHYTSFYVTDQPVEATAFYGNYFEDPKILPLWERDGVEIGPQTAISWLHVVPWGIEKILNWIRLRYDNPPIVITENGMVQQNNASLTLKEALDDQPRIDYHREHLKHVLAAIRAGTNVQGYFAWSLSDNFEWDAGYTLRFGLTYVDYNNNFTRIPKKSFSWFKNFLHPGKVDNDERARNPQRGGSSLRQHMLSL